MAVGTVVRGGIVFSLIYVSSAARVFSESELLDLLNRSREKNHRLNITGMLLYKDGNFMQALEGEQEQVRELYGKICGDPRHHGTLVLIQGPEERRQFPDWSMGFVDLNARAPAIPGVNRFLENGLRATRFSSHPNRARQLLASFRNYM